MVQTGIILTKHHRLLSVAAILDVFETVNKIYGQLGKPEKFKIDILSVHSDANGRFNQYQVSELDQSTNYDLILVPAFNTENMSQALQDNQLYMEWLCRKHKQGASVASFCTGAFLIAAAGLLHQKSATTHIDATGAFAKAFPTVRLRADAVVTQDDGIYTSGGSTNTFHLLLCLIEKYCNRDIAIKISKYFAIDMDRDQQAYFGTFNPASNYDDKQVSKVLEAISQNYANISTLEQLFKDVPASRRTMVRRFKLVTGNTPIEYLQKTRIEAAKKILEKKSGNVLESMIASGYNDEKAFRMLFKKTVGMTPSAYRQKYTPSRL
jgi:transcriptional regulator GlxA family with amidase domain